MADTGDILQRVRQALGNPKRGASPPVPPKIDEPIVRLVHSDIGLAELFARRAAAADMSVEVVLPEELAGKVAAYLKEQGIARVGLPVSPLLERLGVRTGLVEAGLDAKTWDELTLDQTYDLDGSVTDVAYAIAETGSLVVRPSARHGRALSLIPPVHVAIVEPSNCVGDLLDLLDRVEKDGIPANLTLITGPSKTADIEGVLIVGVHGPARVRVFVLG